MLRTNFTSRRTYVRLRVTPAGSVCPFCTIFSSPVKKCTDCINYNLHNSEATKNSKDCNQIGYSPLKFYVYKFIYFQTIFFHFAIYTQNFNTFCLCLQKCLCKLWMCAFVWCKVFCLFSLNHKANKGFKSLFNTFAKFF